MSAHHVTPGAGDRSISAGMAKNGGGMVVEAAATPGRSGFLFVGIGEDGVAKIEWGGDMVGVAKLVLSLSDQLSEHFKHEA